MKILRRSLISACLAAIAAAVLAAPAGADFGLQDFDVRFVNPDGSGVTQAGSHPYAMEVAFNVKTVENESGGFVPAEQVKDLEVEQIEGFAGDPTAVPPCTGLDFLTLIPGNAFVPQCADASAIGVVEVDIGEGKKGHNPAKAPVYDVAPAPGSVAKLGFWVQSVPVVVDITVDDEHPYNVVAHTRNISQVLEFFGAKLTIWGNPANEAHDEERGLCYEGDSSDEVVDPVCPAGFAEAPFLTLPRACEGPLATRYEMDSWPNPGKWVEGFSLTHDDSVPPNPRGFGGCGKLGFAPLTSAVPSTTSAESSSGLDFSLAVNDEGLSNPTGIAQSDIRKVVVSLPTGVTVNPSAAEGLGVCSKARFEAEGLLRVPGKGCPDAAKLGTVEVETPVLEGKTLRGSLFLAQQDDPTTGEAGAENPFDSLLALYLVIRDPQMGIFVKQAGKVETDAASGRIITAFDDIPQFPLSRISVDMRSGPRAPLITPPTCGTYTTKAVLTPWSGGAVANTSSTFTIDSGPAGGPCPSGGVPGFNPGFEAGTVSNAAGSYSPFDMRITRGDGEQDLTRFSAVLPPGVVGKIAGLEKCSDAAIAAAKLRRGREEIASPSCPANSRIGGLLAGAGVGSALTYVPGSLYLAGSFGGDPLSVVAIVPAVAGPFDVGTVVTRVALTLNPRTTEVEVDGANSDPIPHILEGIPLKVRDLRVQADRPDFTLNSTSCDPSSARATMFGSFLDVFDPADDVPVLRSARYQAASCASLGFAPKLTLRLKGGTKRGDFPAFKAVVVPRPGHANFAEAVVTLPPSAFLEQGHFRTICTRVQFAAKACPQGAIYGRARAWSPLIDGPAEGPVYLRSSDHDLPDLVAALKGPPSAPVEVELPGRIDSFKRAIRGSFEAIPDIPVSRFELSMRGGAKGLIINSRNLCLGKKSRARATFIGQNGKRRAFRPVVKADCKGKARQAKRGGAR